MALPRGKSSKASTPFWLEQASGWPRLPPLCKVSCIGSRYRRKEAPTRMDRWNYEKYEILGIMIYTSALALTDINFVCCFQQPIIFMTTLSGFWLANRVCCSMLLLYVDSHQFIFSNFGYEAAQDKSGILFNHFKLQMNSFRNKICRIKQTSKNLSLGTPDISDTTLYM